MTVQVETHQTYDYVIVGTGAAGSTLAYSLPRNVSILMVDIAEYGAGQALRMNPLPYVDQLPDHYTPEFSGVLGGNTALWPGKVYLIAPQEMTDWPIQFKDLEHHSESLAAELGIPHTWVADRRDYDGDSFFHTSYRSNIGNAFEYFNLDQFPNVSVLERHNLIGLMEDQGNIRSVMLSDYRGKKLQIRVENAVILAAGALGNTQLHLNLIESGPNLRQGEAYGRLRDHPHFNIGRVKRAESLKNIMKGHLRTDRSGDEAGLEDCLVLSGGVGFVAVQIDGPATSGAGRRRRQYRANGSMKTLMAYRPYGEYTIVRGCKTQGRKILVAIVLFPRG